MSKHIETALDVVNAITCRLDSVPAFNALTESDTEKICSAIADEVSPLIEQRDMLLEALGLAADILDMIGQYPQTVVNIRRVIAKIHHEQTLVTNNK